MLRRSRMYEKIAPQATQNIKKNFLVLFDICLLDVAASLLLSRQPLSIHGDGLHAWRRSGQSYEQLWCSWKVGQILLCWSCSCPQCYPLHGLCSQVGGVVLVLCLLCIYCFCEPCISKLNNGWVFFFKKHTCPL